MNLSRRGLITGLICFAAAPAIVRIESLMPVKAMEPYGIGPMMHALEFNYDLYLQLRESMQEAWRAFHVPDEFLKEIPHVVTQGPYCRLARNVQGPIPDNHGPDGITG